MNWSLILCNSSSTLEQIQGTQLQRLGRFLPILFDKYPPRSIGRHHFRTLVFSDVLLDTISRTEPRSHGHFLRSRLRLRVWGARRSEFYWSSRSQPSKTSNLRRPWDFSPGYGPLQELSLAPSIAIPIGCHWGYSERYGLNVLSTRETRNSWSTLKLDFLLAMHSDLEIIPTSFRPHTRSR